MEHEQFFTRINTKVFSVQCDYAKKKVLLSCVLTFGYYSTLSLDEESERERERERGGVPGRSSS
jgi:hypothetical protein